MSKVIKICQVGAGLIGQERISAVMNLAMSGRKINLCAVYDPYLKEKSDLLYKHDLHLTDSMKEIIAIKPDWVFISTPHDASAELARRALSEGFNVLMEKPLGRDMTEAKNIVSAQVRPRQLYIGFNYRFYEGINMALEDMHKKIFGNIISVSMTLGHGGSPKDKDGWKLNPEKAGGGVLIDPGIHLLDLCGCMFGNDIVVKDAMTWSGSWKTGIEEEAHVLMQSAQSIINLQASIVKWRSTFRIEINGDEGYGIVEGRGRSYGKQRYTRGKKWGWMSGQSQKETETIVSETDGGDVFEKEIDTLLYGNKKNSIVPCNGDEALAGMKLLDACRIKAGI